MTTSDAWTPLIAELNRWQAAGKRADFWLRDDDAVEPTPALSQLLDMTGRQAIPVTLAVIPAHTGQGLADFLASMPYSGPSISVAVHGWSHVNHAGEGEKKQELGSHRPVDTVLAELGSGFAHLQALHPERFTPVLVPPWNRIAAPLIPALGGLGFRALSVFGPEKPASLTLVNSHVDLMDWHGTRGARETPALVADIVKRLQQMFDNNGVMGMLTHHLVHDDAAWRFLDGLFDVTLRHPACRWVPLADMLDQH